MRRPHSRVEVTVGGLGRNRERAEVMALGGAGHILCLHASTPAVARPATRGWPAAENQQISGQSPLRRTPLVSAMDRRCLPGPGAEKGLAADSLISGMTEGSGQEWELPTSCAREKNAPTHAGFCDPGKLGDFFLVDCAFYPTLSHVVPQRL